MGECVGWAGAMDAAAEAALRDWCQRAFSHADPVGAALLLAVERNDFALGLNSHPLADGDVGAFREALRSVGVAEGAQHLPEERVGQMRAVKNSERELFHERNTAAQHSHLRALLAAAPPPSPAWRGEPELAAEAASRFVAEHRGNIGTHPFLGGLRATLEAQLSAPQRAQVWRTPWALLSQSGGEAFATAAVTLLSQVLGFELLQVLDCNAADAEGDGWVDWQTHPAWSDRGIGLTLSCLPAAAELEARPAGECRPAAEDSAARCSAEDIPAARCSFCTATTIHALVELNRRVRSIYCCRGCGGRTLPCRTEGCGAMTRGGVWDNNKCEVRPLRNCFRFRRARERCLTSVRLGNRYAREISPRGPTKPMLHSRFFVLHAVHLATTNPTQPNNKNRGTGGGARRARAHRNAPKKGRGFGSASQRLFGVILIDSWRQRLPQSIPQQVPE